MNAFLIAFALIAAASASYIAVPVTQPIVATRVLAPAAEEGQYVHDYTEKLYDDGSYKPEIRTISLVESPLGLVPAGSGLEGQYAHDLTEKLYDDGSYKPEPTIVSLVASPLGLVPAGSGLEGQYVHDANEKVLYNEGSYRQGHYA